MEIIQLKNVSKKFDLGGNEVIALDQVSLFLPQGEIVALMGPSGSGKSTILNLVGALDFASEGEVVVLGEYVQKLSLEAAAEFRNRQIGFIFQNFNLIPVLTTIENVLLPAQLSRQEQDDIKLEERAKYLLQKVGLEKQVYQSVNRLSGGQMQRVAVARSLMNNPKLILADEPTANLDHATSEKVLDVFRELCLTEKVSALIATHDESVLPYCHRVVKMKDGKIISNTRQ